MNKYTDTVQHFSIFSNYLRYAIHVIARNHNKNPSFLHVLIIQGAC